MIVGVNILHGICYAFFFATVYIFVDEHFPKDVRSSAQGLFNLMILGIGALMANFMCPPMFELFTKEGTTNFHGLFLIPCGIAVLAAVLLAALFWPPKKLPEDETKKPDDDDRFGNDLGVETGNPYQPPLKS